MRIIRRLYSSVNHLADKEDEEFYRKNASIVRKVIGKDLLQDLEAAQREGEAALKRAGADHADELINTALSYRELRDYLRKLVRRMARAKTVADRDPLSREILDELRDRMEIIS